MPAKPVNGLGLLICVLGKPKACSMEHAACNMRLNLKSKQSVFAK